MWKRPIPAVVLLALFAACHQTKTTLDHSEPNAAQKALMKLYVDAEAPRSKVLAEGKAQLAALKDEVARNGPTPERTDQIARLEAGIRDLEKSIEKSRIQFEAEYRQLESAGR